jgi:hypothetical protein
MPLDAPDAKLIFEVRCLAAAAALCCPALPLDAPLAASDGLRLPGLCHANLLLLLPTLRCR